MDDRDVMARAKAAFDAIYHGTLPTPQGDPAPGTYPELNMKMIADTWGDDRISMRDKRLVVLSLLIGSGADPSLFMIHVKASLKSKDLSPTDIRVLVNFGLFYAGVKNTSLPWQAFEAFLASPEAEYL